MTCRGLLTAVTAVTAVTALLGACDDTTVTGVTELNLDRPVDISFACYRNKNEANTGQSANTALPTTVCQDLSPQSMASDVAAAADAPDWYGFILQSASGTVALTAWPSVPAGSLTPVGFPQQISDTVTGSFKVLDADPLIPGKNALSIGEDPVAIGTDKSGCFEVTANAGSCDLSQIDITSALSNIVDHNPARPRIDRVTIFAPDGQTKVLSKPSAMIVEPFREGLDTVSKTCPAPPAAAMSKLYIAYPSCHLVAKVQISADMGTLKATVVGGIHFDDNGTPSVLAGQALADAVLSCPTECEPDRGVAPVLVKPGLRPVALDYRLDLRKDDVKLDVTSKLAIGADNSATLPAAPLTVVDLDPAFDPVPGTLLSVPLEGGVGVSALALSPQIGMGGDAGNTTLSMTINDETNDQAQYVYAVATDGTVRVADVLNRKRECDTQIDGRFLRNVALQDDIPTPKDPSLDCLPMGRPELPRRPGARSPGIELPGGAVASSVAIVKGLSAPPTYNVTDASGKVTATPLMPPQPNLLLGYFAVITASSGAIYVANIDDDYAPDSSDPTRVLQTSPVLVMAHQLRDNLSKRDAVPPDCSATDPAANQATADPGGPSEGGPRLTQLPVQQSLPSTLSDDLRHQLPRLQQVACDRAADTPVSALEFGALEAPDPKSPPTTGPAVTRDTVYPDLRSVVAEGWTLTYEGTLELDSTLTSVNGPSIHSGQAFVDGTGMFIADASRPFCHMGVEPGDIVEFQGCDPAKADSDCPAGYTCFVHPSSAVRTGACFLKTEAPRLQDACRDFLSSVRRYTVGTDASTTPGKLVLFERKHELSTTPVDGCVNDAQCDDLARAAVVINQSADPFVEPVGGQPQTQWACRPDPLRKPIASGERCVQTCTFTPRTAQNQNTNAQAPFCATGTVCVPSVPRDPSSTDPVPGVCMEGIEPAQSCLNGPQRYVVRAGEAFTVIGDHTGFVHPIVRSADGSRCVRDPELDKDPLSIGRIPLSAPPCNPTPTDSRIADPLTGLLGSSTQFEANPCSLTVQQFDFPWNYPAPGDQGAYGSCRSPSIPVDPDTKVSKKPELMEVPAIKFRNRALTLTLVEPYRQAAQSCLGRDPGGVSTRIPLVVPGYQISFNVKSGYEPLTLSLIGQQVSPVKVVRGPSESIWIIDDGDFIGNGITDVTTRGRVFRVESVPAPQGAPGTNPNAQFIINIMQ